MKHIRSSRSHRGRGFNGTPLLLPLLGLVLLVTACAPAASTIPATPAVLYRAPTYGEITPGPHKYLGDLSTTIEIPPFAYSLPIPPQVASPVDGLYGRMIPLDGTPTPCKRCAGYRVEGGLWTLYLDKGTFKVFQQESEFEAVGSFAVAGDHITFFNDPYCEEDLSMVGSYTWKADAVRGLELKTIDDPCSIGLRARNLTATPWIKMPADAQERAAACQPPNREAAVTDHWKKPVWCR